MDDAMTPTIFRDHSFFGASSVISILGISTVIEQPVYQSYF